MSCSAIWPVVTPKWLGVFADPLCAPRSPATTNGEVVLMKDAAGRVIGFEKLNFRPTPGAHLRMLFETVGA